MLLHPQTLDLAPRAGELLERLAGDARFKPELPASQLEIVTTPADGVAAAVQQLARGRRDLAHAAEGLARPAVAGVHPFAAVEGELTEAPRYEHLSVEYGRMATRQLVASLQVHVAVGRAARTLAVYNALRSHLPDVAALAANAAFHGGEDTGMASIRPKLAESLPRQGMPPSIESWEAFACELRWGARAGSVPEPRLWWWELRPHVVFGTLEVRVPDAQTTIAEAAAVAAVVQSLVAWLSERHDAGERLPVHPSWRIAENRWSAARHGVEGDMADLDTGDREATRERLARLIGELRPVAERLGCAAALDGARELVRANGAMRQREAARASTDAGAADAAPTPDPHRLAAWLAERFLVEDPPLAGNQRP